MKRLIFLLLLLSGQLFAQESPKSDPPALIWKHALSTDLVSLGFFTPNLGYEYRFHPHVSAKISGGYTIKLPYGGIKNTLQNRHSGPFALAGFRWNTGGNRDKAGLSGGLDLYWGQNIHTFRREIDHFYNTYEDSLVLKHNTWGLSFPFGVYAGWQNLGLELNVVYNRAFRVRKDPYAQGDYFQPGMGILSGRRESEVPNGGGTFWVQIAMKYYL